MILDWKEKISLVHYTALYEKLDPVEISVRCRIPFDAENKLFYLRFMGSDYTISYPQFEIKNDNTSIIEKLLFLRYLCNGKWIPYNGTSLSYREIPWGEVYYRNFEGRCIMRFARMFGSKPDLFTQVMECKKELKAECISKNHPAYRFEFISNLYMSFLIWPGDDEFPAAAQIIFDDNVSAAFSAEDIAALGEAVIIRIKTFSDLLNRDS
ncbi:MAG: DUF3786 domain-containing protein [Spirochaetaceae bacterium]|nr:DUF3786 domain-containing protein [Spirochaetaceae bacterium]